MKKTFKYLSMNLAHKKFRKLFSQELNFLLRRIDTWMGWWLDQILTQLKRNGRRLSSYSNRAIDREWRQKFRRRLYRKMLIACKKLETTWVAALGSDVTEGPFNTALKYQQNSCLHKCLPFRHAKEFKNHRFSENPIIADGWMASRFFFHLGRGFPLRKQTFSYLLKIRATRNPTPTFKTFDSLVNNFSISFPKACCHFLGTAPHGRPEEDKFVDDGSWVDTKNSAPTR